MMPRVAIFEPYRPEGLRSFLVSIDLQEAMPLDSSMARQLLCRIRLLSGSLKRKRLM